MYFVNNAKTGIPEIDNGINKYLTYLARAEFLPEGSYVLAGGAIRSLLDGTRLNDLDIYILGSKEHHNDVINSLQENHRAEPGIRHKFRCPFVKFTVLNINEEYADSLTREAVARKYPQTGQYVSTWEVDKANNMFKCPIQLISFAYDSNYKKRIPAQVDRDEDFVDTHASNCAEIVDSFDLSISKGAVEFVVNDTALAVSTITIPTNCLVDISMRKLRHSVNTSGVPQQNCLLKRFYKFTQLGYSPDETFYQEWQEKLNRNPHFWGTMSYDD